MEGFILVCTVNLQILIYQMKRQLQWTFFSFGNIDYLEEKIA